MIARLVSRYATLAVAAATVLALTPPAHAQRFFGGRSSGGAPYGNYAYGPGFSYGGAPGYSYGGAPGYSYGGAPGFSYGVGRGFSYGVGPNYYGGYNVPGNYGGYMNPSVSSFQPHVGVAGYQGNFRPYAPYSIYNYGYYQPFGTALYSGTQPIPTTAMAVPGNTSQSLYSPTGNIARLTVRVPDDAHIWVDNQHTQLTGPVRVLNTPPLQPGQGYYYVVKAQWNDAGRQVTQERTVRFKAGDDMTVDFTQPEQPGTSPATPPLNPGTPVTPPPA